LYIGIYLIGKHFFNFQKEEAKVCREDVLQAKAIVGRIDMECPSQAKIVRIFTSSTFTGHFYRRTFSRFMYMYKRNDYK
jgi:hypothetical protein